MTTLHNYMETLVAQYLDETLETDPAAAEAIGRDPAMRARVMACALNHIPPFYVTGKTGEVFGSSVAAISQNKADIMVEIAKAIEVIAKKGYT